MIVVLAPYQRLERVCQKLFRWPKTGAEAARLAAQLLPVPVPWHDPGAGMPVDERRQALAQDIQAVIWDFGGVISSSPFDSFRRFEQERGLPQDFLRGVNASNHHDNAWARFERNDIDLEGFDQAFAAECAALGQSVRGREVIELLGGTVRPAMVEALRRLKPRLKIGLITNNVASPDSAGLNPSGRDEVLVLFHVVIESSKAGVRKPDPAIYVMMCDALGVAPGQAVFLDDLGVNLKPARQMGMHTIKVEDPDVALQQLEALVGFALRGPA